MTRNFPIYTGKTIHDGRIVLLEVIGRGGMSVVYKAIDVVDPARPVYAVKWLGLPITRRPLTAAAQRQYLALLDSECALHGSVSSHPNVVTLHRVIQDEARDCRWMVLDYHPGGDLFRAVTSRNPLWMNEARTKRVFIQLVDALAFCHSRRVYHQDIKPENILLSEDGESVYLSDFGLSTNESFCSEKTGTDYYNPPEALDPTWRQESLKMELYSSVHGDVWSLIITMFNLLTGARPWDFALDSCPQYQYFMGHKHSQYMFEQYPLSDDFHRIFVEGTNQHPDHRLNLHSLRQRLSTDLTLFPMWVQPGAQDYANDCEAAAVAWSYYKEEARMRSACRPLNVESLDAKLTYLVGNPAGPVEHEQLPVSPYAEDAFEGDAFESKDESESDIGSRSSSTPPLSSDDSSSSSLSYSLATPRSLPAVVVAVHVNRVSDADSPTGEAYKRLQRYRRGSSAQRLLVQ